MSYDIIEKRSFYGITIEYGIKKGSSTLVFIKTGRGGNVYGENERQSHIYEILSTFINGKFGFTVVVSTNPLNDSRENPLLSDFGLLKERFNGYNVIYVGYSAGANYGAWYGFKFDNICKMLLINPIINFNSHKTLHCIENFKGDIRFIFGKEDASMKYAFILPNKSNVSVKILENQSHNIDEENFIKTVDDFLTEHIDENIY